MLHSGDRGRAAPYVVLGIALLAVSNGAIFARLAAAPPLAIAAWRVGLALLVVLPFALTAQRPAQASRSAYACAVGAGALLAAHFATWIASLEHTTIARSVLLVNTSPIWVAVLQFIAGRGAPSRSTVAALALAVAGATIVSSGGRSGEGALLGDLLAVAGGIAMAGYFLLSRESQKAPVPDVSRHRLRHGGPPAVGRDALTGTPSTGYDARGPGGRWRRWPPYRSSSATAAITGRSGT
jgi:drug/metabolite transporter (DMT)-like permease